MFDSIIKLFNLQYDEGGLGSLLVLSKPIWGFVSWAPGEILFALNHNKATHFHVIISYSLGIAFFVFVDWLFYKFIVKK